MIRDSWPPKPPERFNQPEDYTVPIVVVSVLYTLGVLFACFMLAVTGDPPREKRWVPSWARNDACLAPLFFVLPAFFWPLAPPAMVLTVVLTFLYFSLRGLCYELWSLISPATSCYGIPLPPRRRSGGDDTSPATASSASDLEMGPAGTSAEDGAGRETGDGVDESDPAGVRCAGSGESERPPSYSFLPPDENESGEADGLLAENDK